MLSLCISDIHSKYDALTPAVSWQLRLRDRCQVGAEIEREGRGRGQCGHPWHLPPTDHQGAASDIPAPPPRSRSHSRRSPGELQVADAVCEGLFINISSRCIN